MTLGQKIKKARTEANLTQKELADQLSVTFQTVSKWESNTTEPDLATLRAIAKALGVSLEYLVSDDEEEEPGPEEEEEPIVPIPVPEKRRLGRCADCGTAIIEGDLFHMVERKTPSGVKETVMVCDYCFKKHEKEIERRTEEVEKTVPPTPTGKKSGGIFHKITERDDRKPLIWAIILGLIALVAMLIVCIIKYDFFGLGWTIGAPILAGYAVMATIYCIFTASYISEVFMSVASWSVRFPGLIFSWSLEGFMWLIAMKFLFFILGIVIGICVFLLALSIAIFLSVLSFIPLLIYNKAHYA